jgi:hypothetical protein
MLLTAIPSNSLRPDTALIHALQQSGDYDYQKELMEGHFSIWQWLWEHVSRYLERILRGVKYIGDVPMWVWVLLAVVVLAVIVGVFILRKRGLFYRNRRMEEETADDEDNIYGVDFDKELAKAAAKRNWRGVVRLRYLQTLKALADANRIDWRPSKTPTQYTREVTTAPFREMTRLFLRVRYGGFAADEAMAQQMLQWQQQVVTEGGEA